MPIELNTFYKLYIPTQEDIKNDFDLDILESNMVQMILGNRNGTSTTLTRPTVTDDYDIQFYNKLIQVRPHLVEEFIQYHYENYADNNLNPNYFVKNIEYVILNKIEAQNKISHASAIKAWISSKK